MKLILIFMIILLCFSLSFTPYEYQSTRAHEKPLRNESMQFKTKQLHYVLKAIHKETSEMKKGAKKPPQILVNCND